MSTTQGIADRRVTNFSRLAILACLSLGLSGCRDSTSSPAPGGTTTVPPAGSLNEGAPSAAPSTPAAFATMTPQSGVDFTYHNGQEAENYSILESLGGGVALFDYDADGELDLFLPGGGGFGPEGTIHGLPSALYRQARPWQFTAVTEQASVAQAPYFSHGAAAADFDNDGFQDVLVTGYGGLLLFHNQGDGTFTETAKASGLTDALWSSSTAWGDIDGDGALDLYVAHYVDWSFENHPVCPGPEAGQREVCSPRQFNPLPDVFYSSNGDGTFRDATRDVGLRTDGKGLGVVIADVDVDGHPDVYVGNDTVPNFLYRNNGHGKLLDQGLLSGASVNDSGTPDGSMGVDVGDFNRDGLPDIWVANYERESFALYRNEGRCFFQHVSQSTGVMAVAGLVVGWGTAFLDVDRDGDEDIVCSNGHVIRYPVAAPLRQLPLLFENRDGRHFVNVAPAAGKYFVQPHSGRGLATGDVDQDGDVDLAVMHTNEPVELLSNESVDRNGWIGLRLIGTRSSRCPVGARATLTTADGSVQTRQVKGGGSYASTSDRRLFFGLGDAAGPVDVEIRWPSGARQRLRGVGVGRYVDVVEPPGERSTAPP